MMQSPEEGTPKQKRVVAADEGARYTKQLMAEVTRLRNSKQPRWSADRLAEEMTKVGVPWTRSTVNNLESGRRKQIAVHEVLALAWVLDAAPVGLLAPGDDDEMLPVTPDNPIPAGVMRTWLAGDVDTERLKKIERSSGQLADAVREIVEDLLGKGYSREQVSDILRKEFGGEEPADGES